MAVNPSFVVKPHNEFTVFTDADTTVAKAVYSVSADLGALVRGILLTTDSAVDISVDVYVRRGGVNYPQNRVAVVDGAGRNGTDAPVNLLNSTVLPFVDEEPNRAWPQQKDDAIYLCLVASLAAGKSLWVSVYGGDY